MIMHAFEKTNATEDLGKTCLVVDIHGGLAMWATKDRNNWNQLDASIDPSPTSVPDKHNNANEE